MIGKIAERKRPVTQEKGTQVLKVESQQQIREMVKKVSALGVRLEFMNTKTNMHIYTDTNTNSSSTNDSDSNHRGEADLRKPQDLDSDGGPGGIRGASGGRKGGGDGGL